MLFWTIILLKARAHANRTVVVCVNMLTHVFERCMWSFGTCFQLEVARWGYGTLGGHRLTKHLDYLVFLHAFIASYNFLAKCIWGMKGRWVALMHVWKKPLEYLGMIWSLRGPLGPQKGGKPWLTNCCWQFVSKTLWVIVEILSNNL